MVATPLLESKACSVSPLPSDAAHMWLQVSWDPETSGHVRVTEKMSSLPPDPA